MPPAEVSLGLSVGIAPLGGHAIFVTISSSPLETYRAAILVKTVYDSARVIAFLSFVHLSRPALQRRVHLIARGVCMLCVSACVRTLSPLQAQLAQPI